jgi:hypothetical protein
MTDRELLEAAARAAGRKVFSYIDDPIFGSGINDGETDNGLWNPLENDGDALRLAVDLRLSIDLAGRMTTAETPSGNTFSWHHGDAHAATRRAIVHAAAFLSRSKL